jgi:hypothetical protein
MTGERFSSLYVRLGDPASDSVRARHRIGALLGEVVINGHIERLAAYLERNLGLQIPGNGQYPSQWQQFIRDSQTTDFLDTVTMVYRYFFWHLNESAANCWRDAVRQIFNEENLGYEIDDAGGLHPRVDREFQRNLASAVAGLQSERYKKVRELIGISSNNLCADPPNYRQAWRAMLSAVDVLFGLMFPHVGLSRDELERHLQSVVERTYEGDPTAQKAAQKMVAAFGEWVEASQSYRHQPGAAESPHPPGDIAILSISHGASLMRWLAGLGEARAP